MAAPYRLWVGYDSGLEEAVTLDDEIMVTDEDGAGVYDADGVAELLNRDYHLNIVLPWMGNKRVCRDEEGHWSVEHRCPECKRCLEDGSE